MIDIFNRIIRTSTRTDVWNTPEYWRDHEHLSSYERQTKEAAENRIRLAREKTML